MVERIERPRSGAGSSATYLLRLDDICPTMRWDHMDRIEQRLLELDIRPILGVIPQNEDRAFHYCPPNPDFWERIRAWQSAGWSIGMHGYQHLYVSNQRGVCGTDPRSEFAGVAPNEQRRKLLAALEVFETHGVAVDAWVAPNHSFDRVTIALLAEIGIDVISDGFNRRPHTDAAGILWAPCQLHRYVKRRSGVWTMHYHPNYWTDDELDSFLADLEHIAPLATDLATVKRIYADRAASPFDSLYTAYRVARSRLRRTAPAGPSIRATDPSGPDTVDRERATA